MSDKEMTDTEIVDFLGSLIWESQCEGQTIGDHYFVNPTGSFRDAVIAKKRNLTPPPKAYIIRL